jgi:hypothetical protein
MAIKPQYFKIEGHTWTTENVQCHLEQTTMCIARTSLLHPPSKGVDWLSIVGQ